MILFKNKKLNDKKIKETKESMQKLFQKVVKDCRDYKLIYAYDTSIGVNGYIYQNKIIGYRPQDMSIIMIDCDPTFQKSFKATKFFKTKITKATYNNSLDFCTIYKSFKKEDIFRFYLVTKNYKDEDILPFIEQESEIEEFKDFYFEFKRKLYVVKKKK